MPNNPTDQGPKLPTRNVYVIQSADDLPQVLSQYVIYNLQYDPGDGIGLYFTSDGVTLERIGAGVTLDQTFLTADDETGTLVNSRQLLAGDNVTFDDSVSGERTVDVVLPVAYPPQLGYIGW